MSEYWMKHFSPTGPADQTEEALANQLRALDQQTEAIMKERQRIYGEIRSHRRARAKAA
jgi:hypothetical protein